MRHFQLSALKFEASYLNTFVVDFLALHARLELLLETHLLLADERLRAERVLPVWVQDDVAVELAHFRVAVHGNVADLPQESSATINMNRTRRIWFLLGDNNKMFWESIFEHSRL